MSTWDKEIDELLDELCIDFHRRDLLRQAFTHRSFVHECGQEIEDYRKLESLGDAVLELTVREFFLYGPPRLPFSKLSDVKNYLISNESLARISQSLGLRRLVLFGHGQSRCKRTRNVDADIFEALIGTLYVGRGLDLAKLIVTKYVLNGGRIDLSQICLNPKRELQEWSQSLGRANPVYRVVSEIGPSHDQRFSVQVLLGEESLAFGSGKSKKQAEIDAARNALKNLKSSTGE